MPRKFIIRLSEVHKKTGAQLVSNGIVGRNFGNKTNGDVPNSAPQYYCVGEFATSLPLNFGKANSATKIHTL